MHKKTAKINTRTKRNLIRKADIFLIAIALIASILLMVAYRASVPEELEAQISVNNKPYKSVLLTDNHKETIIIPTEPIVTLEVANGGIAFVNALCPDRSCEKCGVLNKAGSIAVCLPAKVVVTVKAKNVNKSDFDAISY